MRTNKRTKVWKKSKDPSTHIIGGFQGAEVLTNLEEKMTT
jgi:hypothetical protein